MLVKHFLTAFLGAVLGTCMACAHSPGHRSPDLAPDVYAAQEAARAVEVQTLCPPRVGIPHAYVLSGSGVIIGARRVLTANHVASCAPDGKEGIPDSVAVGLGYLVTTASGQAILADLSFANASRDIAELKLHDDAAAPPVAIAKIEEGNAVCVAAARPARTRTCGAVFKVDLAHPDRSIGHYADTIPGNSGSGVYDARGRLVGIATRCNSVGCSPPNGGHASALYGAGVVP